MPRIQYKYVCDKCICDKCNAYIPCANDENDVKFNMGAYVYCERCFQDLHALWEIWMGGCKVRVVDGVIILDKGSQ